MSLTLLSFLNGRVPETSSAVVLVLVLQRLVVVVVRALFVPRTATERTLSVPLLTTKSLTFKLLFLSCPLPQQKESFNINIELSLLLIHFHVLSQIRLQLLNPYLV